METGITTLVSNEYFVPVFIKNYVDYVIILSIDNVELPVIW